MANQTPTYDITKADEQGRLPVVSHGIVTSTLPEEIHKKLYQTAAEEERSGSFEDNRGETITTTESNLITAMMTSTFPTVTYKQFYDAQQSFEKHGKDLVLALKSREGPQYKKALQFLHLIEACGGPDPANIEMLIKKYGSVYGLYKSGMVRGMSHITSDTLPDPTAFPAQYVAMKAKMDAAGRIDDMVEYLKKEFPKKDDLTERIITLPRAIPANNGWLIFYAGLGAEAYHTKDRAGQEAFAKFIHNVTGEDPEMVRVAMNYAMDKGGIIKKADESVADTISKILSGKEPAHIPLELKRLAKHAGIYTEATQDGILDPEEAELLRRYAMLVDGIRDDMTLRRLFSKDQMVGGDSAARNTIKQMQQTSLLADQILAQRTDLTEEQKAQVRQTKATTEIQLASTREKHMEFPIDIVLDYLAKRQ